MDTAFFRLKMAVNTMENGKMEYLKGMGAIVHQITLTFPGAGKMAFC